MKLEYIREKYDEYKDKLERMEEGDYEVMKTTTIEQAVMMRQIVSTLEDLGFHLIVKPAN